MGLSRLRVDMAMALADEGISCHGGHSGWGWIFSWWWGGGKVGDDESEDKIRVF